MTNTLGQSTYEVSNPVIAFGKWEFLLYLLISFIIGYFVHYIFSHRRDYVRSPRKRHGFYYNETLDSPYYPNSEPIIPRTAVQTYTQNVAPSTHYNAEPILNVPLRSNKDDLKIIEGIGPKIEELLNNAGIHTWLTLSKIPVENLNSMLSAAGTRFKMHDPATWSEQSHLAETGQWQALEKYQKFLIGGKHI